MKFLIVGYCLAREEGGYHDESYERALDLGLALHSAGHKVLMYCPGHGQYHDERTLRASELLCFVQWRAANFRKQLLAAEIDGLLFCEMPAFGLMAELYDSSAGLRLPRVAIEDSLSIEDRRNWQQAYGKQLEALLLIRPWCTEHERNTPGRVNVVHPNVESDAVAARRLLEQELGLDCERLLFVDGHRETDPLLLPQLLKGLDTTVTEVVICCEDPAYWRRSLIDLSPQQLAATRVLPSLTGSLRFGIATRSKFVLCPRRVAHVHRYLHLGCRVLVPGALPATTVPAQARAHEMVLGLFPPPPNPMEPELVQKLRNWLDTPLRVHQPPRDAPVQGPLSAILASFQTAKRHSYVSNGGATQPTSDKTKPTQPFPC